MKRQSSKPLTNISKDTELEILRRYFIASEKRRRIGTGEYKPCSTYGANVAMVDELQVELDRLASKIESDTSLLDFVKQSKVA